MFGASSQSSSTSSWISDLRRRIRGHASDRGRDDTPGVERRRQVVHRRRWLHRRREIGDRRRAHEHRPQIRDRRRAGHRDRRLRFGERRGIERGIDRRLGDRVRDRRHLLRARTIVVAARAAGQQAFDAAEVLIDLVVELPALEVLQHRLVLRLHQRLDRVLRRAGVVDQLAGRDDHAAMEHVREQMRRHHARILGLDVKHQAAIADVVVVAEDRRTLGGHPGWRVPRLLHL